MKKIFGLICFFRRNHKINMYTHSCVRCGYVRRQDNSNKQIIG